LVLDIAHLNPLRLRFKMPAPARACHLPEMEGDCYLRPIVIHLSFDPNSRAKFMPRISQFFGVVISMYFNDHSPSHFHAEYAEFEAVRRIR
jgi:hypothetical protein